VNQASKDDYLEELHPEERNPRPTTGPVSFRQPLLHVIRSYLEANHPLREYRAPIVPSENNTHMHLIFDDPADFSE
jgi:hypothetical protein